IVMAVMAALMLMPGMPKWPIAILLAIAFLAWWRIRRAAQDDASSAPEGDDEALEASSGQVLNPLEIAFGSDLSRAWEGRRALLLDRIAGSRESHERNFGIPFPAVRFVDSADLGSLDYRISIHGVPYG